MNYHKAFIFLFLAFVGIIACVSVGLCESKITPKLIEVPMVRLLAVPERFENKRIMTVGYLVYEFENEAIYLDKSFSEINSSLSGIWVDLTSKVEQQDPSAEAPFKFMPTHNYRGWVEIVGVFRSGNNGHFGLFSGEIHDIEAIIPLEVDRKERK